MKMKFNKTIMLFLFIILATGFSSQAQNFKPKFGLRAGLNLATIMGPTEANTTEEHRLSVRVVAGGTMRVPFHERFGMAVELLFVQKGTYYTKEAENSFLKLPEFVSQQELVYGYTNANNVYTKRSDKNYKKRVGMNVINGYIEIPLLFYVQPIKDKLEIDFGVSLGVLISSEALGTLKFGPADVLNAKTPNPKDFIEMDLDYKYIKDDIGQVYDGTTRSVKLGGSTRYYPRGPSSYYLTDQTTKANVNYYSLFDVGFQGGVSYYFTPGLRLGLRFNYSLMDITADKYDNSFTDLDANGKYIPLKHNDANFGTQIFVGLQF